MTISVDDWKDTFPGDGTANVRTTTLQVIDASELQVFAVVNSTGVWTEQTAGVNYTAVLSGTAPNTVAITPTVAIPSGTTWSVTRKTSDLQPQDYASVTDFPASSHELGLDRAALRSQDHRNVATRSMRLHEADTDRDMVLPKQADRANKVASYDANGLPTATAISTLSPGSVTVGTPGQTLLPLASYALWRQSMSAVYDATGASSAKAAALSAQGAASAFGSGFYYATDVDRYYYSDGSNWTEVGLQQFTAATVPSASNAGKLILDTDKLHLYRDNGSALELIRALPPKYLRGGASYASSTTLVAIEECDSRSATDLIDIRRSTQITKNASATWVEGSGNGGRPASVTLVANTWYRVFLIAKNDGTVDAGIDAAANASALLGAASGYNHYRQVGWVRTQAGSTNLDTNFVPVRTTGWSSAPIQYIWKDGPRVHQDLNNSDLTSLTAVDQKEACPEGEAHMSIGVNDLDSGSEAVQIAKAPPGVGFVKSAPGELVNAGGFYNIANNKGGVTEYSQWSNASGQVYQPYSLGTDVEIYTVCHGWTDHRFY